MNIRTIIIYMGYILEIEGGLMIPPLLIAVFKNETLAIKGFLIAFILIALGFSLSKIKKSDDHMNSREGFVIVALGWIVLSLFGAIPFYISGSIPKFIDCWFETVSGFTTTGASIFSEVENLPVSILFWRSFTHWIGGMGVLVFLLAVIPLEKGNGDVLHIFRAESPGPKVGKLLPTMRHTAKVLYKIYIAMTLIECLLLLAGGMPIFDSITNSLATAGTGGFAIRNDSIASYSFYSQGVIAVFMMLFGVNFSLFYLVLLRQFSTVYRNEELRLYIGIMVTATAIIFFDIADMYSNLGTAILDSFFQVS